MKPHSCDPSLVAVFGSTPLHLASRASKLALVQTKQVADRLNTHATLPINTRINGFTSDGDAIKQQRLSVYGGKGLFVRKLEKRLLAGKCDAAVHSGKDMEAELAAGTCIAAVLPRGDRRDALVGNYTSIADLPRGAVVGTASVRRTAFLLGLRPDLTVQLLRGNVPSRLQALATGKYDAIILAKAGLDRLGVVRNVHPIPSDIMLPAAAQGAIVVQALTPSQNPRPQAVLSVLNAIDDSASRHEVMAERKILATLDGSCQTPIAASAEVTGTRMHLKARISSRDGSTQFSSDETVSIGESLSAAETLARDLLARAGGREFLYAGDNDSD